MRSTAAKLGLLGSLYLSQGLPFGFFAQALPVLLRERGLSLPAIGLSSLLALPWALKFAWAPVVDHTGFAGFGRRKSWIVPLQLAAATLSLGLAFADSERALTWLLVAVLLTNLVAATQDVATDGLAVELLAPHERGLGNGVQVAGYRVGMILGGGALLVVFARLGWSATFVAMGGLLLVATLPILAHREPASTPSRPLRVALGWSAWRGLARHFGPWLWVLVTFKTGDALGTGMLRVFLVDSGLGLEDIGVLMGTVGFSAGLFGALVGGWGVGRLGRRRALLAFGSIQTLAVAAYAVPAWSPRVFSAVALVTTVEHFTGGMATAALFTLMMDRARPGSEGTDYTFQASAVVLATGGAGAISGWVAQAAGYFWHFVIAGGLSLVGVVIAARVVREEQLALVQETP